MHCCFSRLEIIHGTVIYVIIIQPIERESKKSDMKVFHPFSLFLALILFIFVPKCNCKVNILQHTVDDVKMPKTNFQHTTYISKNNDYHFKIKIIAKSSAIEKIQEFRVFAAEC